jgi:hypothetical protein
MSHQTWGRVLAVLGVVLGAAAPAQDALAASEPSSPPWSTLHSLRAGTTVVVTLHDGRRLARQLISIDESGIRVLDPTRVTSPALRDKVKDLLATTPDTLATLYTTTEDGVRIPLTERINRADIVLVTRDRLAWARRIETSPWAWLLAKATGCPGCDSSQTLFGPTVLPGSGAKTGPEIVYAAPTDSALWPMPWSELRTWLPSSLQGQPRR